MTTIRETVAHLAIEAARSKPLKDKKIKHETDKTVQAPDDLAREKGKAPDAKTGRIVTSRLKAGGPGSGRKPGFGMGVDTEKAKKLASKHYNIGDKYGRTMDRISNKHTVLGIPPKSKDATDFDNAADLANKHNKIGRHFREAATFATRGNATSAQKSFNKGMSLKTKYSL